MSENNYIKNEVNEFCEKLNVEHLKEPLLRLVADLCFCAAIDGSVAEEAEDLSTLLSDIIE